MAMMAEVMRLRVGTRGSELALWQTRWVCDRLSRCHPSVEIETIVIKTLGDADATSSFDGDWPVGAFVSALESALLEERVDFAVHSFKDLQTAETEGLTIAAVPPREVAHDVLLTREKVDLADLPDGFRVGTGSPRRSAQFRRLSRAEIVPMRGNVPTRVARLETGDLDGVVLAGAGVQRLGIEAPHLIELPVDQFVPSPAQGALAVQARAESAAAGILLDLDDQPTRRRVSAERSLLRRIGAGCQTPVGALATIRGDDLRLHAQLFDPSGSTMAEGVESGADPRELGELLADRLVRDLGT